MWRPTQKIHRDMVTEDDLTRIHLDSVSAINKYINVELIFGIGTNNERRGCVVKSSQGLDSNPIGHAHSNPYFDT